LDKVYSAGDFESVSYRLEQDAGKDGLVIQATPNPLGPYLMRFGVQLSTDFRNESNWAVLAGLRVTRLNGLGAEWKSDLEVGLNRRVYTEFYQPLGPLARWFVAPAVDYSNIREDLYSGVFTGAQEASTYRIVQGTIGADLGVSLSQYGELRIGPRWGHAQFNDVVGPDLFKKYGYQSNARLAGIQTKLTLDHLDSADFPTQGYILEADNFNSLRAMGADDDYRRLYAKWRGYGTWGKNTLFAGLAAGSALGTRLPPYAFFQAGGFETFAGYEPGQLVGPYYGVVRFGYARQIGELPPMLGKGFYVYCFSDVGNTWLHSRDISWEGIRYSGTIAVGTDTRLGPLYVGYSMARGGFSTFNLYLGKRF